MTEANQTFIQKYIFTPVMEAKEKLSDDQNLELEKLMDPSQPSNLANRINDMEKVDPAVANVARLIQEGPSSFIAEETIAAEDGPRLIRHPVTGKIGMYTRTQHADVIRDADNLKSTTQKIIQEQPEFAKLAMVTDMAGKQFEDTIQPLEQLNQEARATKVEGTTPTPSPGQASHRLFQVQDGQRLVRYGREDRQAPGQDAGRPRSRGHGPHLCLSEADGRLEPDQHQG